MTDHIEAVGLRVAAELKAFIAEEALPGTGIDDAHFWQAFSDIVHDLAPKNRELVARREALQDRIDQWHRQHGAPSDLAAYKAFLTEIGYLLPEGPDFEVTTADVDPEIASIAGPQLVVPVMNARYALNAANARWGSLYDALYGTDAIPETDGAERGRGYNPKRGEEEIAWVRGFLDEAVPLDRAGWREGKSFAVVTPRLEVTLADGRKTGLKRPEQFAGYLGDKAAPSQFLLKNNGIHIEVLIDANSPIGRGDPAH